MMSLFKSTLLQKEKSTAKEYPEKQKSLLTIEEMHRVILHERARADRQNHEFSIIILEIEQLNNKTSISNKLVEKLRNRLRLIDEIGWYDEQTIGILFPYTSSENAVLVVDELVEIVQSVLPAKFLKILTYPSIWPFKK